MTESFCHSAPYYLPTSSDIANEQLVLCQYKRSVPRRTFMRQRFDQITRCILRNCFVQVVWIAIPHSLDSESNISITFSPFCILDSLAVNAYGPNPTSNASRKENKGVFEISYALADLSTSQILDRSRGLISNHTFAKPYIAYFATRLPCLH